MDVTDISLGRLWAFLGVMETRGFTPAARRLRVGKNAISQQIAKLERELGLTLFTRTTRKVVPTEAANTLYEACRPLLRDLQSTLESVGSAPLSGTLRITAPSDYAATVLCPALAEFGACYPQIRIELVTDSKPLDLVEHGLDVGVRLGWPRDSSLRAVKIAEFGLVVVAAPSYLATTGKIRHPADLPSHRFIALSVLQRPCTWLFKSSKGDAHKATLPARFSASTVEGVLGFARCGTGIAVTTDFSVARDLEARTLVRLLPTWRLPRAGIYLTWPSTHVESAKVRALVEFLRDRLKQAPP